MRHLTVTFTPDQWWELNPRLFSYLVFSSLSEPRYHVLREIAKENTKHFVISVITVLIILMPIGLFKMFSPWIWGIFNIQIQSDRGHKLMLFMFQNKDKDLLGIYQYGCDLFCVSLLTDRHLKVRSNSILFTFSDKGALTSARDS